MHASRKIDRRGFFRTCAGGALLAFAPPAACSASPQLPAASSYPASPVVVARSPKLQIVSGRPDKREIERLLAEAMMRLTGAGSAAEAWHSLFKPDDVVALKLNCLSPGISTRSEVTEAVIAGLRSAGVPAVNIIVWERTNRELESAGYNIDTGRGGRGLAGARCFGTDVVRDGGYEPQPEIVGEVGSCFSQVLTRICTALINIPVLKDHDLAGVSGAMKNNYGVIHNPNRYHDNNCDPYVAQLNSYRHLVSKQRLVVCDAVTAQCNSGPAFKPAWAWGFGGLLISRDPVAHDAVGTRIIEAQRAAKGLPTLAEAGRPPRWLATAGSMGLGDADPSSDKVLELG